MKKEYSPEKGRREQYWMKKEGKRYHINIYSRREEIESVSPTEAWKRRTESTVHVSTITPIQREKQENCNDDIPFREARGGEVI